jgi:hypothetical protein
MGSISRTKGVFAVIRSVVRFLGVESAVFTLLQLDRRTPSPPSGVKHLLAFGKVALMVVANFGNHIAFFVVRNAGAVNYQFTQGITVRERWLPARRKEITSRAALVVGLFHPVTTV